MIQRFLMRRAYNSGKWRKSREYANKLMKFPKEREFARSVVIRSYWNEGQYEKVLELNLLWGHSFHELSDRARYMLAIQDSKKPNVYTPKIKSLHANQPQPKTAQMQWNPNNMVENFYQEDQRLWMIHPNGWTHWDMPPEFSLAETHPALLILTAEVLLSPWIPSTQQTFPFPRTKGWRAALAFSAGTDSTAASFVLPDDTIHGYHRRNFHSILDHRNATRLLNHLETTKNKSIVDVSSNHELLRTYHYKQIGFSTDFASASHLILLADTYDIGGLAFGMVLDNTWLMKGRKFRDFPNTRYFKYWRQRFLDAGIDLLFPIGGVSEAGAMKICEVAGIVPHMNSCLRGNGKGGCGKCWKCFHKNGPLGRPFDINAKEIQVFLQRRPLPTATHALWALQQLNLETQVTDLEHLFEQDFHWWTAFYPPAVEILPEQWRQDIREKIGMYLDDMDEPFAVESINHFGE